MRIVRLASVALLLSACLGQRESYRPERAASVRDAGSVHVAVLAVAPWGHYASVLQPQFNLDADRALDLVVRDSRSMVESSLDSLQLAAAATEDPEEHGTVSPPRMTSVTSISPGRPSLESPDPMLMYWSATSLYQEVQLLNRYVRDAAIPPGFRAYLVRLQISLMPKRRNEPYDVYTTLSFFSPAVAPRESESPAASTGDGLTIATPLRAGEFGAGDLEGPKVMPLLVTDNLESTQHSRAAESVRRMALSLLSFGGWATQLNADLMQQQLQAEVYGRDLNSLLSVARVSENSLRVRIGAMQQATANFAMVPRNHNVTMLVMVPEEEPPIIQMVTKTTLVDTGTGEELPGATEEEVHGLLRAVHSVSPWDDLDLKTLETLLVFAQRNDQQGFYRHMREVLGEGHPALGLEHSLWIDLVSLMVGSRYASSRFDLPGHGEWEILPAAFFDQTVLVRDDGKTGCVAVVHGASFADSVDVGATLQLNARGRELTLPADRVERDATTRSVRLIFPSLAALGLAPQDDLLLLRLSWDSESEELEALYLGS